MTWVASCLAASTSGPQPPSAVEPVSVPELRLRWLDHHEHLLPSSAHTVAGYRTATDHLLRFLGSHPVRHVSHFTVGHAGAFARRLHSIEVSPNGHATTPKRALMDKGLKYALECCRALFAFAAKRRHLPPNADNPFRAPEVDRIPVERARPVVLLTADQERAFLEACDDWQFPLFLTLLLTGLARRDVSPAPAGRPGPGRAGPSGAEQAGPRLATQNA